MIMIPRGGVKKIQVYWDPKVRPIFENLNKGNKNDLTFFKDLNIYSICTVSIICGIKIADYFVQIFFFKNKITIKIPCEIVFSFLGFLLQSG